jgi:hypothetical protein
VALAGCDRNSRSNGVTSPSGLSPAANTRVVVNGLSVGGMLRAQVGQRVPLSAVLTAPDGSTRDVTAEAIWTTGNAQVVSLDGMTLEAVGVGTTTVSARHSDVLSTVSVQVDAAPGGGGGGGGTPGNPGPGDPPGPGPGPTPDPGPNPGPTTVTSVSITGGTTLGVATQLSLTALALLSSGTTIDVTSLATWTSTAPLVASVSGGTVTGLLPGSATIQATYGGVAGQVGVTVSVVAPPPPPPITVTSVNVTGTLNLTVGGGVQLTATATRSDGSVIDVTGSASWSSGNSLLASVSGGSVTGLLAGATSITATYQGVSGSVNISIAPLPKVLTSVSIGGPGSVRIGQTIQLTLTAHYNDGSTENVTASANWSLNNLLGSLLSPGLLQGLLVGSVNVTASYGGQQANTSVSVTLF